MLGLGPTGWAAHRSPVRDVSLRASILSAWTLTLVRLAAGRNGHDPSDEYHEGNHADEERAQDQKGE